MIFNFNNVGVVDTASIELKGITVITGLNDTGKSFISKSIFSVIKAINEANEEAFTTKSRQLQQLLNQIAFIERQNVGTPIERASITNINQLSTQILDAVYRSEYDEVTRLIQEYQFKLINIVNTNEHPIQKRNKDAHLKNLSTYFTNVERLLDTSGGSEKIYTNFFDKIIIPQLFQNQINNITNNQVAKISSKENEIETLNVSINKNKTEKFEFNSQNFFEDVILIETPLILQLVYFITNVIAYSPPVLQRQQKIYQPRFSGLPYHYFDLAQKIFNSGGNVTSERYSESFNKLKEIIGGIVHFDVQQRNIVFTKNDNEKIQSSNIATGIKSLGLLQLLLSTEIISPKCLLIIDEPEVHLHPEWQTKYAEILVELAMIGIPIVISTHSPFIVKAISTFTEKYNFTDRTKFYLGDRNNENKVFFEDVTLNLEPIYNKFSFAMQKLFFSN